MASKKSVTLTKGGREIVLTVPRDIVEYKAAGWREKADTPAPVAGTPADVPAAPKPAESQPVGDNPRSVTEQIAGKGGSKK